MLILYNVPAIIHAEPFLKIRLLFRDFSSLEKKEFSFFLFSLLETTSMDTWLWVIIILAIVILVLWLLKVLAGPLLWILLVILVVLVILYLVGVLKTKPVVVTA